MTSAKDSGAGARVANQKNKTASGSRFVAACGVFGILISIPLSWATTLPIWAVSSVVVHLQRKRAGRGSSNVLNVEQTATLVLFPIAALLGTVGSGVAFYGLAVPDSHSALHRNALGVLALSVTLWIELTWLPVWAIARHRNGSDILPFEDDVDSGAGIATLRDWSAKRPRGVFGQRYELGAEWVTRNSEHDMSGLAEVVDRRLVFALLKASCGRHKVQSWCLGIGATMWLLFGVAGLLKNFPAGLLVLGLVVCGLAGQTGRVVCATEGFLLWQIRLTARRQVLEARMQIASSAPTGQRLASIEGRLVELSDRIDYLILLEEKRRKAAPLEALWRSFVGNESR